MAFTPDESSTGMAPTTAAGLAALFGVFGAFYFMLAEKQSKFVKLYVAQSLRIFILAFLGGLLYVFAIGLGLFMKDSPLPMVVEAVSALCYLAYIVSWLVLTVNAFQGKVVLLPMFSAGLANKLHLE